jgi:hypothetical protein
MDALTSLDQGFANDDFKLFIPSATDFNDSPLRTPSLDSLKDARTIASAFLIRPTPKAVRPVFFRSYTNTPASVASYYLKDARKLPLYEVQLQAGVVDRRRRMTPSVKRRREAMLARIAAMEELLDSAEEEEAPFEKRTHDLELKRHPPKQVWKQKEGSSSGSNDEVHSWTPMDSKMLWTPPTWNPMQDPVHIPKEESHIRWAGPRAPGHHISPKQPQSPALVAQDGRRYNGELESIFSKVKPARNWAETVAAASPSTIINEAPPLPQAHDFPPLRTMHSAKPGAIARPSKGKEIVTASNPGANDAESEHLSKDGYRFSSSRGRLPVKRELAFF